MTKKILTSVLYIQLVKAIKMSIRKDHLTANTGMDSIKNCSGGVRLSWKVVLTGTCSQNITMWVILKFCRRKGGTKEKKKFKLQQNTNPNCTSKHLECPFWFASHPPPWLEKRKSGQTATHHLWTHTNTQKHLDSFQSKFLLCESLLNGFPKRLRCFLWEWLCLLGVQGHVVIC